MSKKPYLEVGYVARAHGLKGELAVKTFDAASETLYRVKRLMLRSRGGELKPISVLSARPSAKEVLLTLQGVSQRGAAEALVGSTLLTPREELPPLEDGEFFLGDLLGLTAVDAQGRELGKVQGVQAFGPVPNLVVSLAEGEEMVLPFVEPFVGEVDLEAGQVVVQAPEFLE